MIFNQLSGLEGVSLFLVAFASLGAAGGARAASQNLAMTPQLYLTKDAFPKKGYVEAGAATRDGVVAFRVCNTSSSILVKPQDLLAIAGGCNEPKSIWALNVGHVSNVKPDGTVQIVTLDGKVIVLTGDAWNQGFAQTDLARSETKWGATPSPNVGDWIGGLSTTGKPDSLFIINSLEPRT